MSKINANIGFRKSISFLLIPAMILFTFQTCFAFKSQIINLKSEIYKNPFKYSGCYQDSESGMYYLNARYYSPELMRFISRDTYDLSNRYAYCDGNPIANVDLTGHSATLTGKLCNWYLVLANLGIGTAGALLTGGSSAVIGVGIVSAGINFVGQMADLALIGNGNIKQGSWQDEAITWGTFAGTLGMTVGMEEYIGGKVGTEGKRCGLIRSLMKKEKVPGAGVPEPPYAPLGEYSSREVYQGSPQLPSDDPVLPISPPSSTFGSPASSRPMSPSLRRVVSSASMSRVGSADTWFSCYSEQDLVRLARLEQRFNSFFDRGFWGRLKFLFFGR